jgi:exonuclease SbcD
VKILHFADLHLGMENYGRIDPVTGLHSRLGDFLRAFDFLVDYALKNKVDAVIFAGDAYKTRDPSPTYLRAFAERVYKMANSGIPVVLVVGNHDVPNATGRANTLDIFSTLSVPNVYVSRQPELLEIKTKSGTLQVVTSPFTYKSQWFSKQDLVGKSGEEVNRLFAAKLVSEFEKNLDKLNRNVPAVAVVHGVVEGAQFGSERSIMVGSEISFPVKIFTDKRLSYVAVGHIHKYQEVWKEPPVVYSGSLERIDFGEEKDPKGFVIVELGSEPEFVEVPTRKFLTITIDLPEDDDSPTETVVSRVMKEDVKDAVVKVIIECSEQKAHEIREMPIREALAGAHFIAGVTKNISRADRVATIDGYSDTLLSAQPLETLELYLKGKDYPKEKIEKIRSLAQTLLESIHDS